MQTKNKNKPILLYCSIEYIRFFLCVFQSQHIWKGKNIPKFNTARELNVQLLEMHTFDIISLAYIHVWGKSKHIFQDVFNPDFASVW